MAPRYQVTSNWRLGIAGNFPLSGSWAMQPAAMYTTMYILRPKSVPKNQQVNPNALEVPINIAYKFKANSNTFIAGAGPYVAYQFKTYELGPGYPRGSYSLFKQFNMGVNASVGYEWQKGWFLRGYFQCGLTNMYDNAIYKTYPFSSYKRSLTNFNFGVTAGYFFKMRLKKSTTVNTAEESH